MNENAVLENEVSTDISTNDSGAETGNTAMNGLEALKYKTTSHSTSSDDSTGDVVEEAAVDKTNFDNADSKDKKEVEKSKVDPEVQEFLKEKGLDLGDLAANENVMSLVNSFRDSEAEKARIKNEHQLENDAMARKKAEANVDKVLDANKQDKPVPLSPLKQAQENYVNTVGGIMEVLGFGDDVTAFEKAHPELYNSLHKAYQDSKDDAQTKEYEWHKEQDRIAQEEKKAQDSIQREYDSIKVKANDMILEAKKDYPEIAEDFEKYGINKFVDTYQELTKVPNEYFLAEKGFFDFVTTAARNARIVESMPELKKDIKASLEKQINRTKKAETVSSDDPLPDDHKAVALMNFKKSFGSPGRGVRIK